MARDVTSENAWRKSTLTVEQLAQALHVELLLGPPETVLAALSAGERAQVQLAFALQRLRQIDHVASIDHADPSSLVFVEEGAAMPAALSSGAGAILLPASLVPSFEDRPSTTAFLLTPHPRLQFARAALLLRPDEASRSIHPAAFIAAGASLATHVGVGPYAVIERGATIGEGSSIGAGAVIGADVVIGLDCRIYPRVVLYPGTQLGNRVVVHAGAVLGANGFGYVRDPATGSYVPFPQHGTLVIEDDVEIGANTTIDRGALEETRIARGAKLDNLVHVGHNVKIGANAILAAQVGISGSSTIGAGVVLAGQVGIGDHAAVGEGVILGGQGGVLPHKTLRGPGMLFWGTPARPVKQCLREIASLTRLARRGRRGPQSEPRQSESRHAEPEEEA